MKRVLLLLAAVVLMAGAAVAQEPTQPSGDPGPPQPGRIWSAPVQMILWDNGDTDGTNGYSNADPAAFGARREIMDDFDVPAIGWGLEQFVWLHLWNTLLPGTGTGVALEIVEDSGGTPNGASAGVANVTGYAEAATGRTWFGRPEVESTADFDLIPVSEGTYWVEFNIIGPENNFAMIRATVTGAELWVDYEDLGGRQSGTTQFGVPADLAYALLGVEGVPTMPIWAMLALGLVLLGTALWWLRA